MASIYTGILYDDQTATSSGSEEVYKLLWKTLYDSGIVTKSIQENVKKEEVGTPSDFMQLFYLSKFIRYLVLYQTDINKNFCNPEYLANLKDSYKLNCIRQTMFCKYGYENIFDLLLSKISIPTVGGIGTMIIEGRCNPFIVN